MPVAVLGNGGIQKPVPVAVNGALQPGGAELGQIPGRGVQHPVALGKNVGVQHCRGNIGTAALAVRADDAHHDFVSGLNILPGEHLLKADFLLVQLHPIDAEIEVVPLGQIQLDAEKAVGFRREAVGQVALIHGAVVLAVALTVFLKDVDAVAKNPEILQPVLEIEAVVCDVKLQIGKLGVRQEAQGQIGLIFQQHRIAESVDLREIGAGFVLSVPLQHIFQS